MTARQIHRKALVITIGPRHDRPWWWEQLESFAGRRQIDYARISIDDKSAAQIGLRQMPALLQRVCALLRSARTQRTEYIFTFEADVTCYLIGLLQYVPFFAGPKHVILQFISREKQSTLRSSIKETIARICLRTVHRLIVSSRSEAEYYRKRFGWAREKVAFVPFHTDERLLGHPAQSEKDIVLAAGRSYRDYETLARAVAGTGIPTVIVCGRRGTGVAKLPDEVQVVSEIPLTELLDLIASARVVVLPLEDRQISTGQTVLLQAMALGRPVVATRTAGTEDYIDNGVNGLLTQPNDHEGLRDAIRRLYDTPTFASALAREARDTVANRHLPSHYAHAVAAILGCAITELGAAEPRQES